jgi:phosphoribosyl-AMP cyclohydrolase
MAGVSLSLICTWILRLHREPIGTTIITAKRRVCRGAHSYSLEKSTHRPAGAKQPSGFFVFGSGQRGGRVKIAFEKHNGLVPAIVQDDATGEVLMLGFMNEEALAETQRTRQAVFFSRSRNKLWTKGESSGHVLNVKEVRVDCDRDAILIRVQPIGPGVCHEGYRSCFYRKLEADGSATVTEERTFAPEDVYGGKP